MYEVTANKQRFLKAWNSPDLLREIEKAPVPSLCKCVDTMVLISSRLVLSCWNVSGDRKCAIRCAFLAQLSIARSSLSPQLPWRPALSISWHFLAILSRTAAAMVSQSQKINCVHTTQPLVWGEELSKCILTSHNSNSTRRNCNSDIFNYNCD